MAGQRGAEWGVGEGGRGEGERDGLEGGGCFELLRGGVTIEVISSCPPSW